MRLLSPLLLAVPGLQHPSLIDPILVHPAISALSIDIRPRSRLKNKHKSFFVNENREDNSTLLFDELALVICKTGIVCRKELFETYAAAIYIHAKFPDMKRMADLAAGHGLLSWFLLVLDQYGNNPDDILMRNLKTSSSNSRPRTVVCVDRRMPSSADKIASAMIDRFPELEPRWSYIQSDLNAVVPDSSCLLTSVHACGTLTDYLIELAIGDSISGVSAPLAIVPCCHTVKARNGYRPHPLSGMEQEEVALLVEQQKKNKDNLKRHQVIADVVDEVRCETLNNAGFDVEEVMLPESFTLRNRLLLGKPRISSSTQSSKLKRDTGTLFERTPPAQPLLRIPLADDEKSILHCNNISGRERAVARLIEQIPKHFSPSLVLSIWHSEPSAGEASPPLVETLQAIANKCCSEIDEDCVQCTVKIYGEVNVQSATGRLSQRYQFTYKKSKPANNISITALSKDTAKMIHSLIRERIVDELGDDKLR